MIIGGFLVLNQRRRNTGYGLGLLCSVFVYSQMMQVNASSRCPSGSHPASRFAQIHGDLANGGAKVYAYKNFNVKMPEHILEQQGRQLIGAEVAVITHDGVYFGKLEDSRHGTYRLRNRDDGIAMIFDRTEINSLMGVRQFNVAQLKAAASDDLGVQIIVDGKPVVGKVGVLNDERVLVELDTKPARTTTVRLQDITDVKVATGKTVSGHVASKYAAHEVQALSDYFGIDSRLAQNMGKLDDEVLDAVMGLQRQLSYVDNPALRAKARAILIGALNRCVR